MGLTMTDESVVYAHTILCPSCGLQFSGYLQAIGDGNGMTNCPRCGAVTTQALPAHYVVQIPPADFHSPVHPHAHVSHYPGLYNQPKHTPRLDFKDLARLSYSPTKAFANLYLSTNLQRAMALVVTFSIVSAVASVLVTADMGDMLGYTTGDAIQMVLQAVVNLAVSLLTFLIFGLTASFIAKSTFEGRGERSTTITLLGYCYPAYVLLSIVLLVAFHVGFEGLDFSKAHDWTNAQTDQALVAGMVLLVIAIAGLSWLLWVSSKATSVANDIATGEAALSVILAAIAAGVVYIIVGMVMQLPMGLFL
jgi:hypothetical protein